MNRTPKMAPYTFQDFNRQFPNDDACLEWLKNYLYPDGIYCKNCEQVTKHHRMKSRPSYSCDHCGHHVHPTAGTIFHKSPTPLTIWFYAIFLMASTRCGVSAKQIQRETGVTYKTAWRMFKQIRSMLLEGDSPLGGGGKKVEMDETGIGGRSKRIGKSLKPKTTVFGMVERQGRVRAIVSTDRKQDTLIPMVRKHVLPKTTVFTDDYASYDGLEVRGYRHNRINHSAGVYVVGSTHTQTIEGFWSLIKNGLRGVYHSVGLNYLQTYLNEYSFRYNRRFDTQPMFLSFLYQISKQNVAMAQVQAVGDPF